MLKLSFVPERGSSFVLFEESAKNAAEVGQLLRDMVCKWDNVEKDVEKITDLEHKGDALAHEIIALVHRTFVTPFDREDIALLAHSLDDIVDFIESSADAMVLYKIEKPTERAKELVEIIMQITAEVHSAISELRKK
jgi:predicted phosphate transport protein (TIGR00153 family)